MLGSPAATDRSSAPATSACSATASCSSPAALKDLLIVRGLKHFPQDIELTAERQDAALRPGCSAAFPIDGEEGEAVGIALEVDPRELPADPDEQQERFQTITRAVRTAVSEHHGITLSVVSLLSLGAMPKTSSGKLRRRACRTALLDGSSEPRSRAGRAPEVVGARPVTRLADRIVEIAAAILRVPVAHIGPFDRFASLGMDSLAAMELTAALEDELGVELPMTTLYDCPDLDTLCRFIEARRCVER